MKAGFARWRVAMLAALMLAAGCSELGEALGRDEEYQVEVGTVSLITLARVGLDGAVTGSVDVPLGQARQVSVSVLDRGGVLVRDEVRVAVTNTVVASFQQTGQSTGTVGGTLSGNSRGSTSLRVRVLRSGTLLYESPSIPVNVN